MTAEQLLDGEAEEIIRKQSLSIKQSKTASWPDAIAEIPKLIDGTTISRGGGWTALMVYHRAARGAEAFRER